MCVWADRQTPEKTHAPVCKSVRCPAPAPPAVAHSQKTVLGDADAVSSPAEALRRDVHRRQALRKLPSPAILPAGSTGPPRAYVPLAGNFSLEAWCPAESGHSRPRSTLYTDPFHRPDALPGRSLWDHFPVKSAYPAHRKGISDAPWILTPVSYSMRRWAELTRSYSIV